MAIDSASNIMLTDILDPETPSHNFNKVYFETPSETSDRLNLARTLFDLKEFRKCEHTLQPVVNTS